MKMSSKLFIGSIILFLWGHFSAINLYPWFKHYGGSSSDEAYSIQQTSDGGYIVSGYTYSYTYGGIDFAIYKLNSSGNKQWFKHYGGTGNDRGRSIQQTSDGGYVVAGHTESYTHGADDFAIYKLDSSGNKVWFKHYGGPSSDYGYSIQQTSDGGYVVAGTTHSYSYGNYDFAIYKLNSSGSKTWFKHYGGSNTDEAYSIQQTSDGGYIVGGRTDSYTYGGSDFAIYKLDSSGNKVWFKHYGGTSSDYGHSIQQTSEGGYVVAGLSYSYSYGSNDFAIYKLNSSGSKTWYKHYGGTTLDIGYSIQQTSDGGYVVTGHTSSYTYGQSDFAVYRLNSNGNKTWFKHYGGTNTDYGRSVQQTTDRGYIFSGFGDSYTHGNNDFAIYKLDSAGNK